MITFSILDIYFLVNTKYINYTLWVYPLIFFFKEFLLKIESKFSSATKTNHILATDCLMMYTTTKFFLFSGTGVFFLRAQV